MVEGLHVSICPILSVNFEQEWTGRKLPLRIAESIVFDDVSELIANSNLSALVPMLYAETEARRMKRVRYAFVRRFSCDDRERHVQDEISARLFYQLYVGLKTLRPTSGRFEVLHYELGHATPRIPRGNKNDYGTILCDSDTLNRISQREIEVLASIAPNLMPSTENGQLPIAQAVNSLEIGYRQDFLHLRHLLWVIGLDALFTSVEWRNRGSEVAISRILDFLGASYRPFQSDDAFGLDESESTLELSLTDVIPDVYKLRNYFAHGKWPEKSWAARKVRRSADYSRDISYAEVLAECACRILRSSLRQIWQSDSSTSRFNDKNASNRYYAEKNLIRTRRKH